MLSKKDYFVVSTASRFPHVCPNLRTQLNKGKGYEGIRIVETSEFENARSNLKNVATAEEKEKKYVG